MDIKRLAEQNYPYTIDMDPYDKLIEDFKREGFVAGYLAAKREENTKQPESKSDNNNANLQSDNSMRS